MDERLRTSVQHWNLLPVEESLTIVRPILFVFAPEDCVGNYGRLVLGRNPSDLIDIVFWIEGSCERLGLDIPQSAGGRNHNLGTGRRLEQ